MDDPNEENIERTWVVVNSVDVAEEATTLDSNWFSEEKEKNHDNIESDIESDGISIISESSHLHEGSNDEENLLSSEPGENNVNIREQEATDLNSTNSASQTKINWTFVDSESNAPEMVSSNQFYLNCLQEPVQELSEHELGSVQSDLDSDGVSIISDYDSFNDFAEDDKDLCNEILSKENCNYKQNELATKLHLGIKKYCNGVLIGTVVLAVSSIFLGQYFNSEQIEEDLPVYKKEFNKELKEKMPDKINDFQGNYEVPTALAYCQERHKSDRIFMEHNIKKCLNKIENRMKRKKENVIKEGEVKKLEKYLKIKEQYLEEKEKFLIKREYKLLKAEMKLKRKKFKKQKRDKLLGLNKISKRTEDSSNMDKPEEFDALRVKIKNKNFKEKKYKMFKNKLIYDKFKSPTFKNGYKNKKEQFSEYKEEDYKLKHKKEIVSNYKLSKDERKTLKNKSMDEQVLKEDGENLKSAKLNDNSQYTSSKEDKYDKVKEKREKSSTNYIILGNNNDNQTSGYWVGRLYKGRSDLRNKRHSGDWYFDRASYRKTKRDKAKWYFDWMMDRELLRYKRTFYM